MVVSGMILLRRMVMVLMLFYEWCGVVGCEFGVDEGCMALEVSSD